MKVNVKLPAAVEPEQLTCIYILNNEGVYKSVRVPQVRIVTIRGMAGYSTLFFSSDSKRMEPFNPSEWKLEKFVKANEDFFIEFKPK